MNTPSGWGQRGIPVALAFLLSILPLLLLSREIDRRTARINDEIVRDWVQETTALGRQFEEICQPKFWIGEGARFLRSALERLPGRERADVVRALTRDLRSHLPRGMVAPRVYAWFHGSGEPGAAGEFLGGPGFQTGYKYLFSRLLQRLSQNASGPGDLSASALAAENELLRQISGVLGGNLPPGVFKTECRGQGFPVFYDRAFRYAVWDTAIKDGKPLVTYLLLFPNGENAHADAVRLALREFHRLVPGAKHIPAVIPIRTPTAKRGWRIRSVGSNLPPQLVSICRKVRSEMVVKRPRRGEAAKRGYARPVTGGFPWQGGNSAGLDLWDLRLPGHRLVRPMTSDGWWGLLAPLHPLTGSVAILAAPIPPEALPPMRVFPLVVIALVLWGIWGVASVIGEKPLFISIRTMLGLWVIGLALLPVCSIWGSSDRMFDAIRINRQHFLETELRGTLEGIENRFVMKRNEWLTACRGLLTDSLLTREFEPAKLQDPNNQTLLGTLGKTLAGKGIHPLLIMVAPAPKESLAWFDPGVSQSSRAGLEGSFRMVLEELSLSRAQRKTGQTGGQGLASASAARPPELSRLGGNEFFNRTDAIYESQIGTGRTLSYYNFFRMKNGEEGVIIVLWGEESQYGEFLEEEFRTRSGSASQGRALPDETVAALRIDPEPVLAGSSGDPDIVRRIVSQIRANRFEINPQDGLQRRAFLFSTKLPGYLLVASRSTERILQDIRSERHRLFLTLFLLLLLGVVGTLLIGSRISDPIQAMTNGLQRISQGDLDVKLSEARADETGTAGRNLNQMVLWLKERLNISRFVSGDVMELVARGNHENLSHPVVREAVVLVSDVRSFTTLSESHPPEQMFLMINRHLQGMTRIIREYRGTIDRFIGDAIQVVFYPDGSGDPAQSAALAALEMMREHERIVNGRQAEGLFPYAIGIGIERGTFVTGVLGDPAVRLDFTVLGDAIREAAELEAESKNASHTRIVCSKQVRDELADRFAFVPVPGKVLDYAWEVLGPLNDAAAERMRSASEDASRQPTTAASMASVPRASGDGSTGMFDWRAPVSILAGLVVMLFLALSGIDSIDTSVRETLGRQVRSEIQQEFGVLERINEPRLQISRMIERRVDRAVATWTGDALEKALPAVFADIPSFSWALLGTFGQLTRDTGPDEGMAKTFLRCGGAPFPLVPEQTKKLYWRIVQDFLPGALPPGMVAAVNDMALDGLRDGHQHVGFNFAEDIAYRSPTPVRIDGRDFHFFWISNLSLTADPGRLTAVLVMLPVEACTFELGHRAFVENQTGEQRALALVPVDGKIDPGYVTGVFRSRTEFADLLQQDVTAREIESGGERWQVLSGPLLRERAYRLYVAKAIPSDSFRKSDWVRGALGLFAGAVLLLVLVTLRGRLLGNPVRLGLQTQMIGALLLMVTPLVIQGIAFLERAALEESVLRRNRQAEDETRLIRAIERSQAVYNGYRCGLITTVMNKPGVLRRIMKLEPGAEKETRNRLGELLASLQRFLLLRGGSVIECSLGGPSFVVARSRGKDVGSNSLLKARVLHAPYSRILQQVSPESRKGNSSKDLLIALGADSIREMANPMVSPITLAEIGLGRKAFFSLMFSGQSEGTVDFQSFLSHQGKPRYYFVSHLSFEGNRHHLLLEWQRWLRAERDDATLFCIRRRIPTLAMSDPFCLLYGGGSGFRYRDLFSFIYPEIGRLVSESFTSGGVLSEVVGFQGKRLLVTVGPELSGDPFCFLLVSDLAGSESRVRAEILFDRWLMAGLLLFCVLSAQLISRSFLHPILALTRAAQTIREGNLAARLSEAVPGEFRFLAASFNSMADGVREGSLLSRFVSESVRHAARSSTHVDGADRGQSQRLTVLFAGLANFKTLLSEVPPERLFPDLNRYLEAMSGMIRNNGGEIDKFIGDKILAVFRDDPATGRTSMENAVAAAIAMKRRYREIEDGMHSSLGIGVVTGPVIAGILGTAEIRLEYTVLGDTVNLASRLGDLAQKLDKTGGIFIEAETRKPLDKAIAAGEFTVQALDLPPIKGKTRSVQAFAVEFAASKDGEQGS